jgi:hypothetical protein
MSDPFRDGMQAALARSENLEEENEILRTEIADLRTKVEGLRASAADVPQVKGSPETRALGREWEELGAAKRRALEVLDQLEVVSRRGSKLRVAVEPGTSFTGEERPLDAVSPGAPTEAPERANPWSTPDRANAGAMPWTAPPKSRGSVSRAAVIGLCMASFLGGVIVGIVLQ